MQRTKTDNATLSIQLHERFSADDLEGALALAGDEIEVIAYAFGMDLTGKDQFLGFMKGFKTALPDIALETTNVVSEGDQVVVEFVATGTHTGPLATPAGEIPASGKPVSLNVIEVHEWRDGKLVKLINYQDSASLLRQIGAIE